MLKAEPFAMGLSKSTNAWVEEVSRQTGRPRSAIIETLAEEAARMRRFPGIAFRGPEYDRRAWLPGTALDIWQVIEAYKSLGSVEKLLAVGDVPEQQVRLALAYYEQYPDEIDRAVAENQLALEEIRERYPGLITSTSSIPNQ